MVWARKAGDRTVKGCKGWGQLGRAGGVEGGWAGAKASAKAVAGVRVGGGKGDSGCAARVPAVARAVAGARGVMRASGGVGEGCGKVDGGHCDRHGARCALLRRACLPPAVFARASDCLDCTSRSMSSSSASTRSCACRRKWKRGWLGRGQWN